MLWRISSVWRRGTRKLRLGALAFFIIAAFAGLVFDSAADSHAAPQTRAHYRVIDGDTIDDLARGVRIRLANIDAPELHDPGCAAELRLARHARDMVRERLSGAHAVGLRRLERIDRYGRELAFVSVDGADLGEALIAAGLARPWTGRRRPWCRADGSVRI